MSQVLAALRGVSKAYPNTLAVNDITIEFFEGQIHALLGENGAGKSTLVKILSGLVQPDKGHVEIAGKARRFYTPREALLEGIGVVHQSGSLIETLTVSENLRLGSLYTRETKRDVGEHRLMLPSEISSKRLVSALTPRQRQLVEIHRLMLQNAKLLILDEPTAVLTPQEAEVLFDELTRLADSGYGVVVISHKLPELLRACDRFTILQKGRIVSQLDRDEATIDQLLVKMSGTSIPTLTTEKSVIPSSDCAATTNEIVQLRDVTTADSEEPLCDVNLVLRQGEILGVVGRAGSGATTLLKILRNAPLRLSAGQIEWKQPHNRTGADNSVGYVPAERLECGLIAGLTIAENLKLRRRDLLGRIRSREGRREGDEFVTSLITHFNISPDRPNKRVGTLSGGNKQKVLLAREMDHAKSLLLVESPTAGLDMRSVTFVSDLLRKKAQAGVCIVIYSDDLDELVALSDRLLVFSKGRCVAELTGDQITTEAAGSALLIGGLVTPSTLKPTLERAEIACAD